MTSTKNICCADELRNSMSKIRMCKSPEVRSPALASGSDVLSYIFLTNTSLLWTPALRPFELVQCAIPGRGGELIGVCGVHATVFRVKEGK